MWTRKELKQRARAAIRRNYWLCVVAALLLAIFVNQAGDASHHEEERSGYTTASEYAGETVDDISGLIEQLPGYEAVGKLAGSKRSVFGIIPSLRSAALAFQFSLVLLLLLLLFCEERRGTRRLFLYFFRVYGGKLFSYCRDAADQKSQAAALDAAVDYSRDYQEL